MLREYNLNKEVNISNVFNGEVLNRSRRATTLAVFQRDVNSYLKREITFHRDALNAFRGILNRSPYWSYYGIPLITRTGRELKKRGLVAPGIEDTAAESVDIATHELNRQMIASTPLDPSKRRKRYNIFGQEYYDMFMYDEFPGPGEPVEPSPVLSFLHGLSWQIREDWRHRNDGDQALLNYQRRPQMPTWSWVGLYGAPVTFNCDPDRGKELKEDVFTILHSDVRVWVQSSTNPSLEWTDFDSAWLQSAGKIVPEFGPYIKIETLVGSIDRVTITPRKPYKENHRVKISLGVGPDTNEFEAVLDCPEDAVPGYQTTRIGTCCDLGWKVALVYRWQIYNPKQPKTWEGFEPRRICLVLEPFEGCWRRVGQLSTHHNIQVGMGRDTIIVC